jgi:hypothetical protein
MCLISVKMHVFDACNIIMYSIAMNELMLIPLIIYDGRNSMLNAVI